MITRCGRAALVMLLLWTAVPGSAVFGQTTSPGAGHPAALRFQQTIDEYLKADSIQMPPKHAILFIGSSIFRMWSDLTRQMAPLPVFNRAFGGSRTDDVLYYMDKLVFPYEPRIIVYYCGSNDINAGEHARAIFGRFRTFAGRVKEKLPSTSIFFVSINRAPQKRDRWAVVDSANALVRQFCASNPSLEYIDVNPVLFDSTNTPRYDLYQSDRLHFLPKAYEAFTSVIKPILEKAWGKK
ncbi:MAG: GDSL-type esterase/lipase family protein [Acidobacteriota bacterium]